MKTTINLRFLDENGAILLQLSDLKYYPKYFNGEKITLERFILKSNDKTNLPLTYYKITDVIEKLTIFDADEFRLIVEVTLKVIDRVG